MNGLSRAEHSSLPKPIQVGWKPSWITTWILSEGPTGAGLEPARNPLGIHPIFVPGQSLLQGPERFCITITDVFYRR